MLIAFSLLANDRQARRYSNEATSLPSGCVGGPDCSIATPAKATSNAMQTSAAIIRLPGHRAVANFGPLPGRGGNRPIRPNRDRRSSGKIPQTTRHASDRPSKTVGGFRLRQLCQSSRLAPRITALASQYRYNAQCHTVRFCPYVSKQKCVQIRPLYGSHIRRCHPNYPKIVQVIATGCKHAAKLIQAAAILRAIARPLPQHRSAPAVDRYTALQSNECWCLHGSRNISAALACIRRQPRHMDEMAQPTQWTISGHRP